MSPNLTEEQGLARQLSEVAPVPGSYLVVFASSGAGKRFHSVLEPGDRLEIPLVQRLLGRGNGYSACAVVTDLVREYSFSFSCPALKGTGPVTVHARLHYAVVNPQVLAEQLGTDPLGRLTREIEDLARRALCRLPLADIEAGRVDVEREILGAQSSDERGLSLPHGEIIRNFAPRVGLKLDNLRFTWTLPVKVARAAEDVLDQRRDEEVSIVRDEVALQQDRRRLTAAEEDRLARVELESKVREVERVREGLDARSTEMQKLLAGVVDAMKVAMLKPAERIETVAELRHALRELMALQREGVVLAGQAGSLPATSSGEADSRLLPSGLSEDDTPLSRLLTDLLRLAHTLPGAAEDQRRLTSTSLHLIAEALLAEVGDAELMSRYRGALEEQYRELLRAGALSSNEDRQLLGHLLSPEGLRAHLKN